MMLNIKIDTKIRLIYHCTLNLSIKEYRTKNLRRVPNFGATLTAYNFGQNSRNEKVFVPISKPVRSAFWGKKTFFYFDPF